MLALCTMYFKNLQLNNWGLSISLSTFYHVRSCCETNSFKNLNLINFDMVSEFQLIGSKTLVSYHKKMNGSCERKKDK